MFAHLTWSVVCLAALVAIVRGAGEDDLVKNVPGLIFKSNFKVYSGFLNASGDPGSDLLMHYMLTESKGDPVNDPLLVWFNGGPGCSSFSGAFEELGPFYINQDGSTLFENVYSWNARANVLYLESPIGVGFSYSQKDPNYFHADDNQTLYQNYFAIQDFLNRVQPRFANQTFYLSGESYAGLYLPMLSALITGDADFPATLGGFAIGNGFMDVKGLTNSLVLWSNYHGRLSLNEWTTLKSAECCQKPEGSDADSCDWTQNLSTLNGIDFSGINTTCGKILNPIVNSSVYNIDPYNFYEDCYNGSFITYFGKPRRMNYELRAAQQNTANLLNRDSTDPILGYPCWQEDYVALYFNDPDVQEAYNLNSTFLSEYNKTFSDCNMDTYDTYHLTYDNMAPFFDEIIANAPNFRILVYNGDVDTVCNYLGDAKFIENITTTHDFTPAESRDRWFFRNVIAGFNQRYTNTNEKNETFLIDVLTVKGAGHMVPLDRPGPALQMITNFVHSVAPDYTDPSLINPVARPAPLLNNPTDSPDSTGSTTTVQATSPNEATTLCASLITLMAVMAANL